MFWRTPVDTAMDVVTPATTCCDNCGQQMLLEVAFVVAKKNGTHQDLVFHFCNETCANDFYLERLRKGM